jgi:hypothetical protein
VRANFIATTISHSENQEGRELKEAHGTALSRLACDPSFSVISPRPQRPLRFSFVFPLRSQWVYTASVYSKTISGETFPDNFAQETWFAGARVHPYGWIIDMWLGSVLAALVAA